ncbi:hypothetical protein PFISCL1PPCAC_4804, partial [Pristionchus fissidentatus]
RKINISTLHERITLPSLPDYFDVMKMKMRSENEVLPISQLVPGNMKRGINKDEVDKFLSFLHQGRFGLSMLTPIVEITSESVYKVIDGCNRVRALALYYESESTPLKERTVTCRVFTPLTDLERLVVTNECMFNSKSKPLTTIETATLIRSFLGEDLSARQRNSITSKTIERYAKTACAPCLITSVVLLVRMPLTLFTATSNVLSRYNEGVIKVNQVDSKNHSAFHHMGYKDFHNAR